MTTQATITRSYDGRYMAAQVHQYLSVADASTGALIDLPAPAFALLREGEGDDSENEIDDGQDGGDAEEEQPKKKQKQSEKDRSGASKGQRSHEGPKPIRVLAFHQNNEWMMYQTEDKYIHLYHIHATYAPSGFKHILTVGVPKKVQVASFIQVAFSPSTTHVHPTANTPLQLPHMLVADKTGDIYVICGADLQTQRLELGHLANITGLQYFQATPSSASGGKARNYCISSDSDGKIRISNSPNYFDIQAFCLGHQAFVSSFDVLPGGGSTTTPTGGEPRIISGGLGTEIRLWNLQDGKLLTKIDLAEHKPASAAASTSSSSSSVPSASSAVAPLPGKDDCYVSQVSFLPSAAGASSDSQTVLVSVYPWSVLLVLNISAWNVVSVSASIPLPSTSMFTLADGAAEKLWMIDEALRVRAINMKDGSDITSDALLTKTLESLNTPLTPAQASAKSLAITPENAESFVGGGTDSKFAPTTEEGKARAAAAHGGAGNSGRYISPFSSLHSDHLLRLSLLSASGFTYRRYADKMQREVYIQGKKAESEAKKLAAKEQRKANKAANARTREDEMEE